jgi:hypothetical protein
LSFIQRVAIVLIAAVAAALLTGLMAPWFLRRVDEQRSIRDRERDARRDEERRLQEAKLARQEKVIDTQWEVLQKVSELLWSWRYASMQVTVVSGQRDKATLDAALDKYSKSLWKIFHGVRSEISRLRRFVSDDAFRDARDFYKERMVTLDIWIRETRGAPEDSMWGEYHKLNEEIFGKVSDEIDQLLMRLADEAGYGAGMVHAPRRQSKGSSS